MTKQQRKILVGCCGALLVAGSVAGCHTFEGFGQDIRETGSAVGLPYQ